MTIHVAAGTGATTRSLPPTAAVAAATNVAGAQVPADPVRADPVPVGQVRAGQDPVGQDPAGQVPAGRVGQVPAGRVGQVPAGRGPRTGGRAGIRPAVRVLGGGMVQADPEVAGVVRAIGFASSGCARWSVAGTAAAAATYGRRSCSCSPSNRATATS